MEASLWLLFILSDVSYGVCTLEQCGVFSSPEVQSVSDCCSSGNCILSKGGMLVFGLCYNFSFLSD